MKKSEAGLIVFLLHFLFEVIFHLMTIVAAVMLSFYLYTSGSFENWEGHNFLIWFFIIIALLGAFLAKILISRIEREISPW